MRRNDDLAEGHGGGALLQICATPLERRSHLFISDVYGFGFLPQLGERLLLQILSAVLIDERSAVLLGRSQPGLPELVPVVFIGAELTPNLLDLTIRSSGDLGLRRLEFHFLRLLNENLLVH